MGVLQKYNRAILLVLVTGMYALYQFFAFEPITRVQTHSMVSEGVVALISLAAVFVVQRVRSQTSVYPLLMAGFSVLFIALLTDVLGELVRQPVWIVTVFEDVLQAVGYILIVLGLMRWVSHSEEAQDELYLYATTDDLTGIYNRRQFEAILDAEAERAKRYNTPMALISFDLDHTKAINEHHGYAVGDNVIQEVVRLVQALIRHADTFARVGGDEFQILAPSTDLGDALGFADKLRGAIEDHHFERAGYITASFGVAELDHDEDVNSLLKRTDKALNGSKEGGRNRLVAAP